MIKLANSILYSNYLLIVIIVNKKAFTLIELIVVISILAILWTIIFLSFNWYTTEARDAKRISDTKNLLSKVLIENTKWTPLHDLIIVVQNNDVVIWKENTQSQQWIINFEMLKEDRKSFQDPSNKVDYPIAVAVGWAWNNTYNFVQIATISEKENIAKLSWNYQKIDTDDSNSLFVLKLFDKNWDPILDDEWFQEWVEIIDWGDTLPYNIHDYYVPVCANWQFYNDIREQCQAKIIKWNCSWTMPSDPNAEISNSNYSREWDWDLWDYFPQDWIDWSREWTNVWDDLVCKYSCKEWYVFRWADNECLPAKKEEFAATFNWTDYTRNPAVIFSWSPWQTSSYDSSTWAFRVNTAKSSNRWYGNSMKFNTWVERKDIAKLKYSYKQSRGGSFYPNASHGYVWYHTIAHDITYHFVPDLNTKFYGPTYHIFHVNLWQAVTSWYYLYEWEVDFEAWTYVFRQNWNIYSQWNIGNTAGAWTSPVVIWIYVYNADYSNRFYVQDLKYEITYKENP